MSIYSTFFPSHRPSKILKLLRTTAEPTESISTSFTYSAFTASMTPTVGQASQKKTIAHARSPPSRGIPGHMFKTTPHLCQAARSRRWIPPGRPPGGGPGGAEGPWPGCRGRGAANRWPPGLRCAGQPPQHAPEGSNVLGSCAHHWAVKPGSTRFWEARDRVL